MTGDPKQDTRTVRDQHWRDLMQSAQDGDQAAYARLLGEILPVLRATVRRKWRNPNDVEDIVQDILLSIHVVRHTYDPGRPFGPWLATITARRVADAAQRASSRAVNETTVEVMPETSSQDGTKYDQDRLDDQGEVRRAMAGLSASQQQAIELMKIRGLSLEEASVATGKSVSSLKVTVHRAMKAMRRILE